MVLANPSIFDSPDDALICAMPGDVNPGEAPPMRRRVSSMPRGETVKHDFTVIMGKPTPRRPVVVNNEEAKIAAERQTRDNRHKVELKKYE